MFKLPQEVKEESRHYRQSLEELMAGKIPPARFKGIRVPWGIYSHRGGEVFMERIRIPAGMVSAGQLKALADAAQKYGSGWLHVTTRQDIQLHGVKIEDTANLMQALQGFDLSPRGGGGNTVRNITACARAGICPDESFDASRQAVALTEHLIKKEICYLLPRKFKIGISGCENDCTGCLVNDLGFQARQKDGQEGFKVWAGGGMGAKSGMGKLLEEFIPTADLAYAAEAAIQVFHKYGDPKNRHHNRLRFLIEKLTFAEFARLYRAEFADLKKNQSLRLREIESSARAETESQAPQADEKDYADFLTYSVKPQKQKGYSSVELRIPRGDLSSEQVRFLAELGSEFRATQDQNLIIAWVKNDGLYNLFAKLKNKPEYFYPQTLLDVAACKGALTCNLGICNSPGLSEALEKMIAENFKGSAAFRKLQVRVNGCPNSCGQHPLGKISFYGFVKRAAGRPVPFYKLLIGGRKAAEKTRFAEEVGDLPAKNILNFLKEFLGRAEEKLQGAADADLFLEKEAKTLAQSILPRHQAITSYSDWGSDVDFSLAGLGQGECGAGVLDMIESDLAEAGKRLAAGSTKDLYAALVLLARALLVTKGVDAAGDSQILEQFREKFVEAGIVAYRFKNAAEFALSLLKEESKSEAARGYVKELFDEVSAAYRGMDSTFHFPVRDEIKKAAEREKVSEKQAAAGEVRMDLRGVACPINYVKAKMRLEMMEKGGRLLLYLDPGEPIKNVPASLQNDGQNIMSISEKENYFEVLVKKEA